MKQLVQANSYRWEVEKRLSGAEVKEEQGVTANWAKFLFGMMKKF